MYLNQNNILQQLNAEADENSAAFSFKPDIKQICKNSNDPLLTFKKNTVIFHRNVTYVNVKWVYYAMFK